MFFITYNFKVKQERNEFFMSNLEMLLKEYEKKRDNAIIQADLRKESLYKANPKLSEIDNTLCKEAICISKLLLTSNSPELLQELDSKIEIGRAHV